MIYSMGEVGNLVALVVDSDHSRRGQIGNILSHDLRCTGMVKVEFSDGSSEEFYDGLIARDPPPKIDSFYRHDDDDLGKRFDSNEG